MVSIKNLYLPALQLLKVLRRFMEEEGVEEQLYHKQQAMLGTYNLFSRVACTIQPDKESTILEYFLIKTLFSTKIFLFFGRNILKKKYIYL